MRSHKGRRRAEAPRWRRGWLAWGAPGLIGIGVLASVILLVGAMRGLGDGACAATVPPQGVRAAGHPGARPAAVPQPGDSHSGHSTFFDLDASGGSGCGYPGPPADGLYVALGFDEFAGGAACGTYLTVTGPNGNSVRVQVIDACAPCAPGHIDMSEKAFSRLADPDAGDIPVTYRAVANPGLPGALKIQMADGVSAYWLAFTVINHGNQLSRVEVDGGGGWQRMSRRSDGFWVADGGAGSGPFRVRITDIQGNVQVVSGVDLAGGQVQSTGVMMYGSGGGSRPTTRRTTSPSPSLSPTPSRTLTLPPAASATALPDAPATGRPDLPAAEPARCG